MLLLGIKNVSVHELQNSYIKMRILLCCLLLLKKYLQQSISDQLQKR